MAMLAWFELRWAKTVLAISALTFVLAGSANTGGAYAQEVSDASLAATLVAIVQKQATAWNLGDIDGFMQAYWRNPHLTFASGGQVERGWQATRDRYFKRYPTRDAMGRLTFSELEV